MFQGIDCGINIDFDGFFIFVNFELGIYILVFFYIGFGIKEEIIEVKDDIEYIWVYFVLEVINLSMVDVLVCCE